MDGLVYTKQWLTRNTEALEAKQSSPQHTPGGATVAASTDGATAAPVAPTPNAILNHAYLELMDWDDENVFPEVCNLH